MADGPSDEALLRLEAALDQRRASRGVTALSLEELVRSGPDAVPESTAFHERERATRELHHRHQKLLRADASRWGKSRGCYVAPELSKQQRKEIRECFQLLDADGSGALDPEEVLQGFRVLNIPTRRADIASMLAEIGLGPDDEVDYPAFETMMAAKLADQKEDASSEVKVTQAKGAASNAPKIPFTVMARALRRKKMIDAVMEGGEGREEVSRMPESAEAEREAHARHHHHHHHHHHLAPGHHHHTGRRISQLRHARHSQHGDQRRDSGITSGDSSSDDEDDEESAGVSRREPQHPAAASGQPKPPPSQAALLRRRGTDSLLPASIRALPPLPEADGAAGGVPAGDTEPQPQRQPRRQQQQRRAGPSNGRLDARVLGHQESLSSSHVGHVMRRLALSQTESGQRGRSARASGRATSPDSRSPPTRSLSPAAGDRSTLPHFAPTRWPVLDGHHAGAATLAEQRDARRHTVAGGAEAPSRTLQRDSARMSSASPLRHVRAPREPARRPPQRRELSPLALPPRLDSLALKLPSGGGMPWAQQQGGLGQRQSSSTSPWRQQSGMGQRQSSSTSQFAALSPQRLSNAALFQRK